MGRVVRDELSWGELSDIQSSLLQLALFIGGYLATQMNSTNVESERYSDYFSPMPGICNDTLPKKLKPDMIATNS